MSKPDKKKKEAEAPVDGAEGEGAPKKKGLPIMLIAIIGGAVLLLGGGGAGAYFMFLAPKTPAAGAHGAEAGKEGEAKGGHGAKKEKKKEEKKEGGHGGGGEAKVDPKTQPVIEEGPNGISYFKLPDTIANIESPDGGSKALLKLQLTFECPDEETAEVLKENMPRINDVLQGFIRELRPGDLDGSAGNIQLRQEILRRVNLVIQPQKINAVLIQQMVVN